jgi:hypothetical protein
MMTGTDGGAIGEDGVTDDYPLYGDPNNTGGWWVPGSSFSSVSGEWFIRRGGQAGYIVDTGATTAVVLTANVTGVYKGTVTNIAL